MCCGCQITGNSTVCRLFQLASRKHQSSDNGDDDNNNNSNNYNNNKPYLELQTILFPQGILKVRVDLFHQIVPFCCHVCKEMKHYFTAVEKIITMTSWWARWRLKSPASLLFTQPFIQTQIKEIVKAMRHWPLCGEFPTQKASNAENVSMWWRHHDKRNPTHTKGLKDCFRPLFRWRGAAQVSCCIIHETFHFLVICNWVNKESSTRIIRHL